MRSIFASAFLLVSTLVNAGPGLADDGCAAVKKDVTLQTALADASTFANLRGAAGSVKVKSLELLTGVNAKFEEQKAPETFCPEGCIVTPKPHIIFTSVPNKFLTDYPDKAECQKLFEQTTKEPIVFPGRRMGSVENLNSYFGDLAQGKGDDGKSLYKTCAGSCSPRYSAAIDRIGNGFSMNTTIICGDARDKSEGMYMLTSGYRWECVAK